MILKGLYGEPYAYECQSEFLHSLGITGKPNAALNNLSGNYDRTAAGAFLKDQADSMKEYKIANPAIFH